MQNTDKLFNMRTTHTYITN